MTPEELAFELEIAEITNDPARAIAAIDGMDLALIARDYDFSPADIAEWGEWDDWGDVLAAVLGDDRSQGSDADDDMYDNDNEEDEEEFDDLF